MLLRYSLLAVTAAGFLVAQHGGGGGHSGGGGSGSHFAGSGGGFHSSPRSSAGYSSFNSGRTVSRAPVPRQPYISGFPNSSPRAYGNPIHYSYGWPPTTGARPVFGRPPIRRPGRFGYYGFGLYPGLGFGYYNDLYDPYYDSGPGVPYASDQYSPYGAMPDPNVETGPGYYYPPIPYDGGPQQRMQNDPAPEPPASPVILILKSGQKLEVQNYAIVNGFFWDFTKQNSKRILLADIDYPASAKATEDAGGSLPEESFATNSR